MEAFFAIGNSEWGNARLFQFKTGKQLGIGKLGKYIIGHYPTSNQTPNQVPISIPYPLNYFIVLGVEN